MEHKLLNPPIDVSDIINKNYSDQYLFGTIVKAGSTPTDNQIIAYNNSTKQWDFIDQNVNSVSTVQYEYKNDNTNRWMKQGNWWWNNNKKWNFTW